MERYKATISNTKLYQEIELPPDARTVLVGTGKTSMIRVSRDLFFEEFDFQFENRGDGWALVCGENNYISLDGVLKLTVKDLVHGDSLVLKYKDSHQEILRISFTIDFDYDNKEYDRVIDITGRDHLNIGGTPGCDILLHSPLIGQDVVTLSRQQGQLVILDNDSHYGVYVNGNKIQKQQPVRDYDFFSIIGYSFYYKHDRLYTSKGGELQLVAGLPSEIQSDSTGHFEYPRFNRSTRIEYPVPKEEIPVLDPPSPPSEPDQNIAMSLMPALGMIAVTILVRGQMGGNSSFILFSVCSMGMGIITSIASLISSKKKFKKNTAKRIKDYNKYIADKKDLLNERRMEERNTLEDIYYSAARELDMVKKFSSDLFNRTPDDHDFLYLRAGTGSQPSLQPVGYKQQEKFESEDELANLPSTLAEEYKLISKVPIVMDGKGSGAIGIVGIRQRLYELMKNLLLDVCTRQYYSDVHLFFLMEEESAQKLSWLRLLPHLYNDHLGMRNIVCDDESRNILFEYLYKLLSAREAAKVSSPHILIFVYEDVGIKSHPISTYIEKAKDLGVTFLFFEERKELLPLGCEQVILLRDGEGSGVIVSSEDNTNILRFVFDPISDADAASFAQKLAPVYCEEISLESSLTKNISLFELLNIFSVQDLDLAERWGTSEIYNSMAAPLGVKSKSEIVELNLHEKFHGPHGLVAGTTGSGKSEIMQSYILSMASLFHPYEVGFVIIDFKGGGMVNQFKDLPHLVGAITNIDGREIDRSLLSIKAELRKRQTVFAQHDVNHIDAYIKLFKKGEATVPLPHLILIVDEFAELKMDQPEFMKELISAARIGRSLGVHLILATQKPSGVVDAQIWSNSKFKLCLKVQNKEDSNEVLKSPLAAEIREPGRAYLQVGNNEIFELFQSAYSGAPASMNATRTKSFKVHAMAVSGKKTLVFEQKAQKSGEDDATQLDAIVDYVAGYCADNNIIRLPGICLPPLRDVIDYSEAELPERQMGVFPVQLGIYDDPNNQQQTQVNLDFLSGNTFILGSSQFGKTNVLQLMIRSLAQQFAPEEVSVYILDFGSMALKVFSELNHVGGVVVAADDEKIKTFFRMMNQEVQMRKDRLAKIGITSFSSYLEAGNRDLPMIAILLDNIVAFRELYEQFDDNLLTLTREGLALGITVVATAQQTSGIGYKYLSNFPNRVGLHCNSGDEYGSLFDRCRMRPKNVPGRALIALEKNIYEYQNYLAFEGEKEIERVEKIHEFVADMQEVYGKQRARPIPEVPGVLLPEYLSGLHAPLPPYHIAAGLDYGTVDIVSFNLQRIGYFAISGAPKSGKTNFLRHILECLQQGIAQNPVKAFLLDDFERQLEPLRSQYDFVENYSLDPVYLDEVLEYLEEECATRKSAMMCEGPSALETMPLLLAVVHNNTVFEADVLSREAGDRYKRILKSAKDVKICFIFANLDDSPIAYSAHDMLKSIKEGKNIVYFDNISRHKLTDIPMAVERAYKKPIEMGDAYYIQETGVVKMKTPLR